MRGKKVKFKKILALVVVLFLVLSLAGCNSKPQTSTPTQGNQTEVKKDDYPNKPVNLVIVFGPGSTGDTFGRAFAKVMEKYLGQTIVPVNKEGGSGAIGTSHMLAQPADGYWFSYHSNTLAFTMAAGQAPFKIADLIPLANFASDSHALSVKKDSPFKTFEDVVKYAKDNPGKLKIGGAQTKGNNHVFALKMMQGAGFKGNYIPYDDGGKSVLGLLGGNVDVLCSTNSTVEQQVIAGEARMLAVTTAQRIKDYPNVPTFKELGVITLDNYTSWKGFFAKPGIPEERLQKLDKAIEQTIKDPEWQAFLTKQKQIDTYMNRVTFTPYFKKYVEDGIELFKDVK